MMVKLSARYGELLKGYFKGEEGIKSQIETLNLHGAIEVYMCFDFDQWRFCTECFTFCLFSCYRTVSWSTWHVFIVVFSSSTEQNKFIIDVKSIPLMVQGCFSSIYMTIRRLVIGHMGSMLTREKRFNCPKIDDVISNLSFKPILVLTESLRSPTLGWCLDGGWRVVLYCIVYWL